jgi:hypothetical protein
MTRLCSTVTEQKSIAMAEKAVIPGAVAKAQMAAYFEAELVEVGRVASSLQEAEI